jgi:2-keto-4-pentenoate hydratase/2-oxohepta-3-ene-1,7-dioic acid hydratase in catechol pathway
VKIVVFGDQERVGAWVGEQILDLNAADSTIPADLASFISAGPVALEAAQRIIDRRESLGPAVALDGAQVRLRAPWPHRRIACVGGNYAAHLQGMERSRSGNEGATLQQITQRTRDAGQWGFWKVPYEVAGPDEPIPFPKRARLFDYEGEAAIVLGKKGKDIQASKLDEYVWGVTLLNDWSIRDGMGSSRPMSYNLPKNFDGSTSVGPCIVVGELDPQNVDVDLSINGGDRQNYNTRDMIFKFAEVLEELSRDFTFVPGDIISGGTSVGTAHDQTKPGPNGERALDLYLKPGDVVELSSPQIGLLRNRII